MTKINRNLKDTVFTQVFSQKHYQVELYKTFHPEDNITEDDIECITLENHIMRGMYNDLGLLVKNRLMVFVEAQTRWDEVLDVRLLFYLRDTIVELMNLMNVTIHDIRRKDIPDTEFYVIYTGNESFNKEDPFPNSFLNRDIHVITEANDSSVVSQYIQFSHIVTKYMRDDKMTNEEKARAIIEECKAMNILTEYMVEHEGEVYRSMISILDEEYLQRGRDNLARREGREEGLKEGLKEGREEGLKEGREVGLKEGQERINRLYRILLDEGKQELMAECIEDKEVLEKTLKDYGM